MIKTEEGKYLLEQHEYDEYMKLKEQRERKNAAERERFKKYYAEHKEEITEKNKTYFRTEAGKEVKRNYMREYMARKRAEKRQEDATGA